MLTRHGTSVSHNEALFARTQSAWTEREPCGLDEAQLRLINDSYQGYVNRGAAVGTTEKERFAAIAKRLSDTAVARDFVEFPSKFLEHWIVAPETLREMAVPEAFIAAIGHADDFGQGFATVELTSSALIDPALHRSVGSAPDSATIEKATLARIGMPDAIAPRQRGHAFHPCLRWRIC